MQLPTNNDYTLADVSSRRILDNHEDLDKTVVSQTNESKTKRNLLGSDAKSPDLESDSVKYKNKKKAVLKSSSTRVQPLNAGRKFTKVSLRASSIIEHFDTDQ